MKNFHLYGMNGKKKKLSKRKSMIGKVVPVSTQERPKEKCTACSGSGRYDHNGSPKCGCCNGTGLKQDC